MEQKCIFCGDRLLGSRTREHVLPEWLAEFLNISEASIQPTHFSDEGDVISSRHHPIDQLLCGRVCGGCNNGWMSQLENSNIEVLKDLIQGKRDIINLNPTEKGNLARWACKTAYALHAASNYRKIIPDEHFHLIKNGAFASGVFILGKSFENPSPWVQSSDAEKNSVFSWMQNSMWWVSMQPEANRDEEARNLSPESYKISLQIGGLLLLVAFHPMKNTQLALDAAFHVPLHPL